MRMQSFGDWLIREVAASRMALISAYEKRDHLLYVSGIWMPSARWRKASFRRNWR